MATPKPSTIFDRTGFNETHSYGKTGRVELLAQDVANELNTYKNFGVFPTFNDVHADYWDGETFKPVEGEGDKPGAPGVRSLFNKYSAVLTGNNNSNWTNGTMTAAIDDLVVKASSFRLSNNTPLLDTPENRQKLNEMTGCTVRELVQASQKGYFGRTPYSYADFMYCKHLNRVPNNYLITLRRFPVPVNDSIMPIGYRSDRKKGNAGETDVAMPIGTMVTWLGVSGNDMKSILKYDYNMPFEEKNAQWEDVQHIGGGESGILNSIDALVDPASRKAYNSGVGTQGNAALNSFMGNFFNAGQTPYQFQNGQEDNVKLYGPIDRVKSNYGRSQEGLKMTQTFDLVFEYELKAYNGINPRQAMLDLLGSILSVTYTTGGFWKGGYRSSGARQSSIFSKMSVFKCNGSFTEMVDAFTNDISSGTSEVRKKFDIKDDDGKMSWLDIARKALSMLNNVGGVLIGGMLNKLGRPAKYRMNSLISENPVGLWHITIGNPHHPILSLGNMILKNTTIEHSGPLGMDDFPTQLKVTCKFDRGKPRDQYGIEQMYMGGNDRIIHSMSGKVADMYMVADEYRKNPGMMAGYLKNNTGTARPNTELAAKQASSGGGAQSRDALTAEQKQDAREHNLLVKKLTDSGHGQILNYYFGSWDSQAILYAAKEADKGAFKPGPKQETPSEQPKDNNDNNNQQAKDDQNQPKT